MIIAKNGNIYIGAGVTRIDAWLLAGGNVHTCALSNGSTIKPVEDNDSEALLNFCQSRLTINGPIVSSTLTLRRTLTRASSDSITQDSAEIVNYSPSAIFFGASESQKGGQPITTYLHEISPRW